MRCCSNCSNAIFDEKWGEYKCSRFERRVQNPDKYSNCKHFKKGEVSRSKATEEEND